MDIQKQPADLKPEIRATGVDAERARIEHAIVALELLRDGGKRRRGRPPKWLVAARGRLGDGDDGTD